MVKNTFLAYYRVAANTLLFSDSRESFSSTEKSLNNTLASCGDFNNRLSAFSVSAITQEMTS